MRDAYIYQVIFGRAHSRVKQWEGLGSKVSRVSKWLRLESLKIQVRTSGTSHFGVMRTTGLIHGYFWVYTFIKAIVGYCTLLTTKAYQEGHVCSPKCSSYSPRTSICLLARAPTLSIYADILFQFSFSIEKRTKLKHFKKLTLDAMKWNWMNEPQSLVATNHRKYVECNMPNSELTHRSFTIC